MRTLKTFTNLAEAGFAHSLLEAAGLHPLLPTEQSGSFGYPGISQGVRLEIDEAEYEQALRVLAEGLDAEAPSGGTSVSPLAGMAADPRAGGRIPTGVFVAAGIGFIVICYAMGNMMRERDREAKADHAGEHFQSRDDNHDGKSDHFATYRNGRLAHTEADRNFDGKIDEWVFYGGDGVVMRAEYDNNFDGKPDEWIEYRNGLRVAEQRDVDFNGIPDSFSTFKDGILVQTDIRPNDSPVVIRRVFYEHGVRREEWVDGDADGKFDYRIEFDPFGKPSEHLPMPAGK